jgi:anti-sigma factor (TIGR02949 family)
VVLVLRTRTGHSRNAPAREELDVEQQRKDTAAAPVALSCHEVAKVLQSFLDQEVDEHTAGQVAAHLEMCRRCGLEADVYGEIKASLARSTSAVPELALWRLRHFGEELSCRASGQR